MDKETVLQNIALHSSELFISSNIDEYSESEDGYKMLVSDFTARYIEAYNQAEKELSNNYHTCK